MRRAGHAVVWALVVADIALLVWVAATSLRTSKDIFLQPFGLPVPPQQGNWAKAWSEGGFGAAAVNSVAVAVISSLVAVALAAPAAYALARRRNRTSNSLTMVFALGLGVPSQVLLVPLFVGLAAVELTDSFLGLTLVYIGLAMPFTVYLLTGFFSGIPVVLEEAAAIDGATGLRTFVKVVLPVARGGLITAFLLQFIGAWNETLFAIALMTSDEKITLPVALVNFVGLQQYSGRDWGAMFAGICIILAPMVALFSWLGTRIIQGMTVGIGK